MTPKPINVAIGVIIWKGRCLINRRPQGGHLGGFWEFPGGKFRDGETPEDCLHREVYEELALKIEVQKSLSVLRHSYPDRDLRLHFFLCHPADRTPIPKESPTVKWVPMNKLDQYPFPEANIPILNLLRDGD